MDKIGRAMLGKLIKLTQKQEGTAFDGKTLNFTVLQANEFAVCWNLILLQTRCGKLRFLGVPNFSSKS